MSTREKVLYKIAVGQLSAIQSIGGGFIIRSLLYLMFFAGLFAYAGSGGIYLPGIWLVCLALILDAIHTAMKMADNGL